MMTFGGTPARPPRCKHKCILQEIYHTKPTVPSYLRWTEMAVTYDRADHLDHIPQPGGLPPHGGTALRHQAGAQGAHGRGTTSTSSTCPPSTAWGSNNLSTAHRRPRFTKSCLRWRESHSDRSTYRSPMAMGKFLQGDRHL
jgi:hypothetical protein